MPEQCWLAGKSGRLAAQLYLPEQEVASSPGVVLCHGLTSNKENYAGLARTLQGEGLAALAFDCRGHGESEGERDGRAWEDVLTALDCLRGRAEVDASKLALLGSSLGAHNALCAAVECPDVRALVAFCPASEMALQYGLFDPQYWHDIAASGSRVRVALPDYLLYLERHNLYDVVARIRPRPIFFIHARDDEFVPYTISERLHARAGPGSRLWLLDGGGHTGPRHDPQVIQTVTQWLRDQLR